MFGMAATVIVAFLSIFVPGVLLSFALLRKTELNAFEITVIGLIFGLITPATLTWLEAYLIDYIHLFTFSLGLFEANAVVLTIIGAALCYQQGVFKDLKNFISRVLGAKALHATGAISREDARRALARFQQGEAIVKKHIEEEKALQAKQHEEMRLAAGLSKEEKEKIEALHKEDQRKLLEEHMREEQLLLSDFESAAQKEDGAHNSKMWIVWSILLILMLLSFATRIFNIGVAPRFFEFDPYFDMLNTESILTYGYQLLLSPSAWPAVPQGTVLRVEPLIPYLEAYWYDLANLLGPHHITFSTDLMSYVGSVYPPIVAALLVFVVFLLLYHEYDARIGLIGAALATMMPVLYTTFIAGEQLLEPWGIFALFFFLACYLLAVRNPKDKRLAVLTGIAFVSNFLGAHYYTVTAGILAIYILLQGIINIIRKERTRDFYTLNAIVLAVIILFYLVYDPYNSTLSNRIPDLFGIPTIVAFPLFALVFVAVAEYLSNKLSPKISKSKNLALGSFLVFTYFIPAILVLALLTLKKSTDRYLDAISRASVVSFLAFIGILLVFLTPIGNPIKSYLNLSAKFTTPSKPLFMTVQEYIPTGLLYNFGTQGFGAIGADIFGIPLLVWLISVISLALIVISIIFRRSRTGVLYWAIALPLLFAGFSEVKYLPHLGVVYIILFCIILGELMYLAQDGFKLRMRPASEESEHINDGFYSAHKELANSILLVGVFFIFGAMVTIFALAFFVVYYYSTQKKLWSKYMAGIFLTIIILVASLYGFAQHMFISGENSSMIAALKAVYVYNTYPTEACSSRGVHSLINNSNILGQSIFCNTVPKYWLNAMAWIKSNLGPYAPRALSWWDYGDWINWFGNTNAVLRGDNAVAAEDYATAANLVLGPRYNYTAQRLANFMNTNQSRYLLLDEDLISKWQALNFLACIHINATSEAFAKAQGSIQGVPYILGSSQCEINNDPQYALIPLSVFISNLTQQSISNYCSISSSKSIYARAFLVIGNSLSNNTVCVNLTPNNNGVFSVYNNTGARTNAVIQSSYYLGVVNIGGNPYVEFLVIYLPDSNGTITNAPSGFYTSNYYNAFMLGKLQGFTQVYPANATGVNLVNGTYPVRIFALDNYTGGLPPVPAKPAWVHNNHTMP